MFTQSSTKNFVCRQYNTPEQCSIKLMSWKKSNFSKVPKYIVVMIITIMNATKEQNYAIMSGSCRTSTWL